MTYLAGDTVWYLRGDGTWTKATIRLVHAHHSPASYTIVLDGTAIERNTEANRLRRFHQPQGTAEEQVASALALENAAASSKHARKQLLSGNMQAVLLGVASDSRSTAVQMAALHAVLNLVNDGGMAMALPSSDQLSRATSTLTADLVPVQVLNVLQGRLSRAKQLGGAALSWPVMRGITLDEEEAWGDDLPANWFSWRKLWRFTGPGFLMSIAYIDPGNLEGDLQAGAKGGYTLCWLLLYSTAMGFLLQMLAAKLGVVTGKHLAQHCREEYPPVPRYALWVMTEIAVIGSDIQEVIGSAIAISLLTRGAVPLYAGVLITAVDTFVFLFIERLGVRRLEALFGTLIAIMAAAFGVMYHLAHVPTGQVIEGVLIPRLPRQDLQIAVAMVGSVIMPHNIYLHSALVHSRKLRTSNNAHKKAALAYYGMESALALLISVFINICVLSVFAKGFYGKVEEEIGLENAGQYLGQTFGSLMAIGLLAAGQSSTMTGTYTGQFFVMSGFLDLHVAPWQRIGITRTVAIAPTLLVALLSGSQLDALNQWLNVLQSIQLPFALIPVLAMTSSERVMGKAFANSRGIWVAAWAIAACVLSINMWLLFEFASQSMPASVWAYAGVILAVLLYTAFIAYLAVGPERVRAMREGYGIRRASSGVDDKHIPGEAASAQQPLLAHPQEDGT
ncbi:hypothetical protein WJX72_009884 [[Myrmecia] bisecta]|uniref:Uncharacterized protein n=1 Tax=[Myrmecia] bisecta TaxID=41462 RepID=A0AAW1P692_9CHLO